MKNHHDHIEELINRFVSNTATTDETDELFDIIAAEPERGKDLSAAARLQTEFDRDLALIDVPADTYEAIIAAAPFSSAVTTTTVAGSVTGAGSAAGLFGWVSLNSIMLSVTSGVLALSTLIFMAVTVLEQPSTQSAHSLPGTSASRQTTPPATPQALPGTSASRQTTPQASFPAPLLPGTDEPSGPEQTLITYAQPSTESYALPNSTTFTESYTESYAQPYTESYAQPYTESHTESFIESVTLRVQQRPITSTSIDQQQGAVANLGLELSTPINDELAVGLGMYNDNFPLRVISTTGDTVLSSNMTWGGAHARWTPQLQLPLDVQLFAQLTIGGSSRGMITQPALGLARSFGPLNLGIGFDCSAFAFQNNGAWNMTLQPGLRATLGIKF